MISIIQWLSITMALKRVVEVTPKTGYKEVSLAFRKARAEAVANSPKVKSRIVCPVVGAARRTDIYGKMTIPTENNEGIEKFAGALGMPENLITTMKILSYASGPVWKIPMHAISGTFVASELNYGLIKRIKNDVNSGILSTGEWSLSAFQKFCQAQIPGVQTGDEVWNEDYLYSEATQDFYVLLTKESLDKLVEYNTNRSNNWFKGLGPILNREGEWTPSLEFLGQKITIGDEKVQAISMRDFYDLCNYGFFPAVIEERFLEANLIDKESVAMTGIAMKVD